MTVLNSKTFDLDTECTPTTGARIAAAGSGLPKRLTSAAAVFVDALTTLVGTSAGNAFMMADDGLACYVGYTNGLKKVSLDPSNIGTVLWTANPVTTSIRSLWRKNSTTLMACRSVATGAFFEINTSTGVTTTRTLTTTSTKRALFANAAGTKLWEYIGSAVLSEYDDTTLALTGRSITLSATPTAIWISAGDGVEGIYALLSGEIRKYKLSDLSFEKNWTWTTTSGLSQPGENGGGEFVVDSVGRIIHRTTNGHIDRYPAAGGAVLTTAERLVWASGEIRGASGPAGGGGSQLQPSMAFSNDGNWFGFLAEDTTGVGQYGAVRAFRVGNQTGTFSYTAPAAITVTGLRLPGHTGAQYGVQSGWRAGNTQDFRRTRTYYKRVGVDGSRVEFTPGSDLSLAVASGAVIEISVDFNVFGVPGGPAPYVGGDSGEGPTLYYTTPNVNIIPTVDAGASQLITLPTANTSFTATAGDTDGSISSYLWTQISGPNTPTMTGTTTATLSVSGCIAGMYTFRCLVTDSAGGTAYDEVQLFVASAAPNVIPTATTASQLIQLPTSGTTFTVTAADTDGTIASYLWTQISGPNTATLSGTTTATLTVSGCIEGTYQFRCVVTDNAGGTVQVNPRLFVEAAVLNLAPTASSGSQLITLPTTSTTLTVTATDTDGSIASYLWSFVSGPATPSLTNTTTTTVGVSGLTVAGTYQLRCVITDNVGATITINPKIFVTEVPNVRPVVDAGAAQLVYLGEEPFFCTGTDSDPDGTIASRLWTQLTGPSTAVVAQTTTNTLRINSVIEGTYTFRYTVTDNLGLTTADDVQVFVLPTRILYVPAAGAFKVRLQAGAALKIRLDTP